MSKPKRTSDHRFSKDVQAILDQVSFARGSVYKKGALAGVLAGRHNQNKEHVANILSGSLPKTPADRERWVSQVASALQELADGCEVAFSADDFIERHIRPSQDVLFPFDLVDAPPPEPLASAPLLTSANFRTAPMDAWQRAFYDVYGRQDVHLYLHDMMLQLVVDATRLSEAIRKESYVEALDSLPRVLSWMFSLNSKTIEDADLEDLNGDRSTLADVIWKKYPRRCSLCAQPSCSCLTADDLTREERHHQEVDLAPFLAEARKARQRPVTLDEWVEMFEDVYGRSNRNRTASEKMHHLWEEIGELEVELRNADRLMYRRLHPESPDALLPAKEIQWEAELADVFSWVSSIYLHVRHSLMRAHRFKVGVSMRNFTRIPQPATPSAADIPPFSDWLWLAFRGGDSPTGLRCHKCRKPKCECLLGYERR